MKIFVGGLLEKRGAGLTLGHSGKTETDGIVLDRIQGFSHSC